LREKGIFHLIRIEEEKKEKKREKVASFFAGKGGGKMKNGKVGTPRGASAPSKKRGGGEGKESPLLVFPGARGKKGKKKGTCEKRMKDLEEIMRARRKGRKGKQGRSTNCMEKGGEKGNDRGGSWLALPEKGKTPVFLQEESEPLGKGGGGQENPSPLERKRELSWQSDAGGKKEKNSISQGKEKVTAREPTQRRGRKSARRRTGEKNPQKKKKCRLFNALEKKRKRNRKNFSRKKGGKKDNCGREKKRKRAPKGKRKRGGKNNSFPKYSSQFEREGGKIEKKRTALQFL